MKKFVIAGTLASALAVGVTAYAQAAKQAPPPPAPKAGTATKADQPQATEEKKKAAPKHRAAASGSAENPPHVAPKPQPNTTGEANEADNALALGSVAIPKGVKADGKDLPAGMYQVRLTADEAKPDAKGATEKLERWVEFRKGTNVVGREVVSIVPADEAKLVQKDAPPPSGGSKVQTLKGGDYVRVWINKGGKYYLVHLVKS